MLVSAEVSRARVGDGRFDVVPSFAAGVHRDEVYAGAELLGLDLDQHIANVIEAMRGSAAELGLERSA